jgi:hypothetical protein
MTCSMLWREVHIEVLLQRLKGRETRHLSDDNTEMGSVGWTAVVGSCESGTELWLPQDAGKFLVSEQLCCVVMLLHVTVTC